MKHVLLLSLVLAAFGNPNNLIADDELTNPAPPRPIGPPTPRPPEDESQPQPITTSPRPPVRPVSPYPPQPGPQPTPGPIEPSPQPTGFSYGAIAYSYSTESFGTSAQLRDSYSAETMAVRNCPAQDCNFVHSFVNGCMGLARSYNDGVYFALGRTPAEAQSNAYWSCQRSYGNCRLVTWACSY